MIMEKPLAGPHPINWWWTKGEDPSLPPRVTTTDLVFCPGSKLAFVLVLEPGQGFRDKSLSSLLSRVEEPGQKVSDVKIFFAHHGIRSQDLLPNAWFPCQFT
jgi:hypothetical protein